MRYAIVTPPTGPRVLVIEQEGGQYDYYREGTDVLGNEHWISTDLSGANVQAIAKGFALLALGDSTSQVGS